MQKHWSKVEYLHETVTNPNIVVKGTKSYYSNAWTENFENYCVRYLYGDSYSLKAWKPLWKIDKLYIGNYVCIGAETIILLGGNNTHRNDWISNYPFMDHIIQAYKTKGDTHIGDGVWIGMRSIILPGVSIGEGAVIAAGSVVTKDVAPYSIIGGNPASLIKNRFNDEIVKRLLNLKLYDRSEDEIENIQDVLCSDDIDALEKSLARVY